MSKPEAQVCWNICMDLFIAVSLSILAAYAENSVALASLAGVDPSYTLELADTLMHMCLRGQ